MNDETVLRRLASESIAKGVLPSSPPQQTWGGPGTGVKCALCEARVDKDELELEVEFGHERHHLHLACFSAWDAERKTRNQTVPVVTDEKPQADLPRSAALSPSPSSNSPDALSQGHGDGKIVDDGGRRADKAAAS